MSIILDTHDAFFLLYESVLIPREQQLIDKVVVSQEKEVESDMSFFAD